MYNVEIVTCRNCMGGKRTSCLSDIRTIIENGDIAFMLYSVHVKEKVKELGYKVLTDKKDMPMVMWIMGEDKYEMFVSRNRQEKPV